MNDYTITLSPHELYTLKQALLTAEMHAKKLGAGASRDISALHADIDLQIEHAQIEHPERYREERTGIDLINDSKKQYVIKDLQLTQDINDQIKAIEANYLLTNQTESI